MEKPFSLGLYTGQFNFVYLELPVTARFSFTRGALRPYLLAGGIVSYAISKEVVGTKIYTSGNEEDSPEVIESDKDALGWRGGVGLSYSLTSKNKLYLEYSYDRLLGNKFAASQKFVHIANGVTLGMSF